MFDDAAHMAAVAVRRRGRFSLGDAWRPGEPERRYVQSVAGLVLAYYAAAHIGYAFQFSGPVAAVVWLPVGVAVAFLYLRGMRFWPGVVMGDLLVNNYSTLPVGSALGQSFGNLMEVLVATWLLRRLCPRDEPIATLRGVVGVVVAIACGTAASATIGSLSSWLGNVIDVRALPYVWRTWWLGDVSGGLIVLPLALSWSSLPARPWQRARVLEAALMVAVVVGLNTLVLTGATALRFLVFPALIWAAVRFGARGATVAITIVCAFAIWGATNALGAFGIGSINQRLLETQVFIATVSLSALATAALVTERMRLTEGIRASRARLVKAADEARRRLERDLHDSAQQDVIALRLRLAQAADVVDEDPAEGKRLIAMLERQTEDVLDSLRSISRGIYPALLRDRGLADALTSAIRRSAMAVEVRAAAIDRHPESVEFAAYFCCLEALQNVAKHAGEAAQATVHVWQEPRSLLFEVADSGVGFDPGAVGTGNGLPNMRDRVEALGGSLTVMSAHGSGTAVRGRIPTV